MMFVIYMDDAYHPSCQAACEERVGRVSRQEKDQSRGRIVRSAARLIRERGVEGASVGEVMKDAGLTHGGFYRHFESKDALVDGALEAAFEEILAPLEADLAEGSPKTVGERFRAFYLSEGHLRNEGRGCPAATLAGDIRRASPSNKAAFSAGVRRMLAALARTKPGNDRAREAAAARELAMLVGAVAIARAGDPDLAETMLAACRS